MAEADIPSDLELLYKKSKTKSPDSAVFVQLLTAYSKNFSSIYAVFDAFDECSDDNQNDMLSLFSVLEKSGYKLLISGRPQTPSKVRSQLKNIYALEVGAKVSDLKMYVNMRMLQEKISDKNLKIRILNLIKGVKGM